MDGSGNGELYLGRHGTPWIWGFGRRGSRSGSVWRGRNGSGVYRPGSLWHRGCRRSRLSGGSQPDCNPDASPKYELVDKWLAHAVPQVEYGIEGPKVEDQAEWF